MPYVDPVWMEKLGLGSIVPREEGTFNISKLYGVAVAHWRGLCQLTPAELAEQAGVTLEYIEQVEAGRAPAAILEAGKICKALNRALNAIPDITVNGSLSAYALFTGTALPDEVRRAAETG